MGGERVRNTSNQEKVEDTLVLPASLSSLPVLTQPLSQACGQITVQGLDMEPELPAGLTGMLILATDKW